MEREGRSDRHPGVDLGEAAGEREGVDRDGRGEGVPWGSGAEKGGFGHFSSSSFTCSGRAGAGQAQGRELAGGPGKEGEGGGARVVERES